ncbi:piggyBac transposable element-derived protein 4-like [Xenopus laevis]|uniref:PiggyBac transposable element-derived protein 4-like n=2 Tax=Xenopus laevis TaxID=8355 RepID=A0A8J1KW76_XENLA|nr:piggyBac transposable element-derived protein 4-like [Xenopus laevis]XP_041430611.1 piggyBac transposable element-derived protein 4-like [Xenopus laevis]
MAKRFFTVEEAAALCMASSSEEFSDSDSEYVPPESESDSSTDESPGSSSTVTALEEPMELEQDVEEEVEVEDQEEGGRADAATGGEPAWGPPGNFTPEIPPFTAVSGVKVDTSNFEPINFFHLFLTEAILQDMVQYTNVYAEQYLAQNPLPRYARAQAWHPTDIAEMKRFVGLTLAMGLIKVNSLESYWDTTTVLSIPIFSATMPRNRYQLLLRFLHFNDNSRAVPPNDPSHDRLHKLRPLIDSLSERFATVYTPSQNICIDESLLLFKGRLHFRQYIPSKRARYGIKFYKLCESSSGYTNRFLIYEGKDSQLDPPGCPLDLTVSGKIVWELITPLLGRGYHLYVDNFYTSILLFKTLHCLDTPACGTINRNRKGLPRELLDKKLNRGEMYSLRNDELLAIKFLDRKNVFMLTTIHDTSVIEEQRAGRPPKSKPLCSKEYSKYMGGVDRTDQLQHYYDATRKTKAWYKKVGIYLIQMALRNSYVVYKAAVPGPKLSYYKYQLQIIPALLFGGLEEAVPEMRASDNVARLVGKHFIDTLPPTPGKPRAQKACKVCRKRGIRRDTRYYCPKCPRNPGLCFKPCFEIYHTQLHY